MDVSEQKLQEILALTKENNKMLRKMRRGAFWGSIIKMIIWAIFLIVPIWFYFSYIYPVMQSVMGTFEEVQGVSADAKAQLGGLQELMNKLDPSKYFGE